MRAGALQSEGLDRQLWPGTTYSIFQGLAFLSRRGLSHLGLLGKGRIKWSMPANCYTWCCALNTRSTQWQSLPSLWEWRWYLNMSPHAILCSLRVKGSRKEKHPRLILLWKLFHASISSQPVPKTLSSFSYCNNLLTGLPAPLFSILPLDLTFVNVNVITLLPKYKKRKN